MDLNYCEPYKAVKANRIQRWLLSLASWEVKSLHKQVRFSSVTKKKSRYEPCMFMCLFPDVVIPESPEAYIKLTENTLKSSSGRTQQCALRRHGRVHTACHQLQPKRHLEKKKKDKRVSTITRARRHSGRASHHPDSRQTRPACCRPAHLTLIPPITFEFFFFCFHPSCNSPECRLKNKVNK